MRIKNFVKLQPMDAEKIIGTHAFDEIFDARVISNKNLKKAWKTREITACS